MVPPSTRLSFPPVTFITHQGFYTLILAYMLDSLVRVSRRVDENHFDSNRSAGDTQRQYSAVPTKELCSTCQ